MGSSGSGESFLSGLGEVLETSHSLKLPVTHLDLGEGHLLEAVQREAFDGEAGHDGAEDDGLPEGAAVRPAGPGQIAHEAAGESVAGAGRIQHVGQRVGGSTEDVHASPPPLAGT